MTPIEERHGSLIELKVIDPEKTQSGVTGSRVTRRSSDHTRIAGRRRRQERIVCHRLLRDLECKALPYAVAICRRFGATLHAAHVLSDASLLADDRRRRLRQHEHDL